MSEERDPGPEFATLQRRCRERVDAAVETLLDRYEDVEYVEYEVENDPDRFREGLELVRRDGILGGAAVWPYDGAGRVAMIRHGGEEFWGVPGGALEPDVDDSFEAAARREAHEEAGLAVEVTGLYRLGRKTFYHAGDPDRRLPMLNTWFEGRHVGDGIDLDPDRWDDGEVIAEARWFRSPPERVHEIFDDQVDRWDWPGE